MNTILPKNNDLIQKYLKGKLTETEEAQLFDWINTSDKNYQEFKDYISANQFSQQHSNETLAAWDKLNSEINKTKQHKSININIVPNWLKIAAMLVLAVLSGFFINQLYQQQQFTDNSFNEVIVPNGEKVQLILADGTKVHLNSGSVFKYPTNFKRDTRTVSLEGEGFFDVSKNKKQPFIINTSNFDVKVTGTSFNLNSYENDAESNLVLHSGSVTIINGNKAFMVKPGEKYVFNKTSNQSQITKANLRKSNLWQEGIIVIDDMILDEICKTLERKFNVKIRIEKETHKNIRYTGQFKQNKSLQEILDMIKETSPVKFKYNINKEKNEIIID